MEHSRSKPEDGNKRRFSPRDLWRLALAVVGVLAVVQELRKPPRERSWHGKVGDVVPYDFRIPTAARIRSAYWNPEGPLLSSRAFGVGWVLNLGALRRLITR